MQSSAGDLALFCEPGALRFSQTNLCYQTRGLLWQPPLCFVWQVWWQIVQEMFSSVQDIPPCRICHLLLSESSLGAGVVRWDVIYTPVVQSRILSLPHGRRFGRHQPYMIDTAINGCLPDGGGVDLFNLLSVPRAFLLLKFLWLRRHQSQIYNLVKTSAWFKSQGRLSPFTLTHIESGQDINTAKRVREDHMTIFWGTTTIHELNRDYFHLL